MWSTFKHGSVLAALAALLTFSPLAFALDPSLDIRQYAHSSWTIRGGFSKGFISSIAQTPDGYMWLGTEFGLLRFDGIKTIPWQPPHDQLPSNFIMSLTAGHDGTLWIGTGKGLASWKNGTFTRYDETQDHLIFAIVEDREGTIWASATAVTMGKLCAIRNGNIQCYGEGSLGRGAFNLYIDSKNNLWAGLKGGLWHWSPGPPKFYPLVGDLDGLQALAEDTNGTLLIGWKGDLYRFVDGKTVKLPPSTFTPKADLRRILRDHDGGLWVGSGSQGLLHIHEGKTDVFTETEGLSSNDVLNIFEDRENNIWVATLGGLDRFRNFAIPTFSTNQGLSSAAVSSVLADRDGSVWFATKAGLDVWKKGVIRANGQLNGLPPNSLFQDDQQRIWVSTQSAVGYLKNNRFVPVEGVPGGVVLSFTQDSAGNIWVVNEHLGLIKIGPANDVEQIPWQKLGHKDHASVIVRDPLRGGLWIGFFLGGIAYFSDGQIRESYTSSDGLTEGRVRNFQFDDGAILISTAGGLSRLKNGRLISMTSKNGLPCDGVNWAVEDSPHSLWLYTPCGLVRIDRTEFHTWISDMEKDSHANRTIQFTVFDSSDGVRSLADSGHFSPQVAKAQDGKIWFLPWDGVSVIDPQHISMNKVPPPVHVEQIIADQKIYDATASVNNAMRLPPLPRVLQFDYTALSLVAPEKVQFRYKLEGFDHDWQHAGTRRQAFYTNLPPGHYRFQVAACNNNGVWNEAGAALDFSIAPAYYQALWFRALCVVFLMTLVWSLYQLRRQQLQAQFNMRLEARVNERTRIARELHDTLLQSFHGLMFRFQAARNMLPRRPEDAMQAMDGAITRAEQALAESRVAIQGLRSASEAQADLAQALTTVGQELATRNTGQEPPRLQLIVEGDRRKLARVFHEEVYRMARELLQNAFQHAQAREIEAEIRYDDRMFRLRIRDDGKGIDPKVLEQGGRPGHWGLPGIRERAQKIGAELDFWSETGAGTEIQLTVPANIAYEKSPGSPGFQLSRKAKD